MPFTDFGSPASFFASNTNILSTQLGDGNSIVVYNVGADIRAQLFDPTGQAIGDEFGMPSSSQLLSDRGSIISLDNGNVAFSTGSTSIVVLDPYVQQTQTSIGTPSTSGNPITGIELHEIDDGGFIGVWTSQGSGVNGSDIEYRRFDSDGNPIGNSVLLNLAGDQDLAGISYNNSGVFPSHTDDFVLYYRDVPTGDLYRQMVDSSGSLIGTATLVNITGSAVVSYTAATLSNNAHVVTWEDSDGTHFRQYTSGGIASATVDLDIEGIKPEIVATETGGFIIAWVQVSFGFSEVELREYSSTGTLLDSISYNNLGTGVEISLSDNGILQVVESIGGSSTVSVFYLNLDADNFSGTNVADTKDGDGNDNVMHGRGGDDTLNGLGGNDILTGGLGEDTLNGGNGNDRFYETGPITEVDVYNGGGNTDTLFAINSVYASDVEFNLEIGFQIQGGTQYDQFIDIENITILGSASLVGDGGDNVLTAIDVDGEFDNTISGGKGDDTLYGGGGNDTLFGDQGNDILFGGDGNDTLNGGPDSGKDELYGGDGDDTLIAIGGPDIFDGGDGTDTLDYSIYSDSEIDLVNGTAENQFDIDTVSGIENVIGGEGRDNITGGAEDNVFDGNGDDDTFTGGTGTDVFNGGSGDDEVRYGDSTSGVTINLATMTYTGGTASGDTLNSIEDIRGSSHDDVITGDAGTNHLRGENGDDILDGGLGADVLIGGSNSSIGDTVTYAASAGAVIVNLGGTGIGNHAQGDTYSSIENIIGTGFQDSLTGNASDNRIEGGLGDDFAFGLGGDDTFVGSTGADIFDGGDDSDTVDYSNSSSAVVISLEVNSASGGDAAGDTLYNIENVTGSEHQDTLIGNSLSNTLTGGDEDDFLRGAAGADVLDGGEGTDTASYAGSASGVTVSLETGAAAGSGGDAEGDTLTNVEVLIGSDHDDNLTGQTGFTADRLEGGNGHDTITTNGGEDIVVGGDGDDYINVRLRVNSVADSGDVSGGSGNDTLDFSSTTSSSSEITANLATQSMSFFAYQSTVVQFTVADEVTFSSIENLVGASGDDHFTGDSTANILRGMDGDDVLIGGAGADTLDGGEDNDTVDYSASFAGVNVDLIAGTGLGGHAQGDILIDIEELIGSDFDDTVRGDFRNVWAGDGNDTVIQTENPISLRDFDGGDGIDTLDLSEISGSGFDIDLDLTNGEVNLSDLFGFENVVSTMGGDNILGNSGANTMETVDGFDTVDGLGGTDTLVFSTDILNWRVAFSSSWDLEIGDLANSSHSVEFRNIEMLQDSSGIVGFSTATGTNLDGSDGVDLLIGIASNNIINGFKGNDILIGRGGDDTLNGGDGIDRVVIEGDLFDFEFSLGSGSILADDARGSGDIDTLVDVEIIQFNQSNSLQMGQFFFNFEVVSGNNGNNVLVGDTSDEILIGGAGEDTLFAGGGLNALFGGDGNDILQSGLGADYLHGGAGIDTVTYAGSSGFVRVDLSSQTSTNSGDAEGDVFRDVENLTGSNFDDELTGNNDANELNGGDGNDLIIGRAGNDIIRGGDGDDDLNGNEGDDTFFGENGADSYDGGNLQETFGDTIDYSASSAGIIAYLESGNGFGGLAEGDIYSRIENLIGTAHDDILGGSFRVNTLNGGDGNDTASYIDSNGVTVNLLTGIHGGHAANDTLISIENLMGSDQNDTLTGDDDNNIIDGNDGNDTLDGAGGIDTITFASATDGVVVDLSITGTRQQTGWGNDLIVGFENLIGTDYADILSGSAVANSISGGLGDDLLEGRAGGDTLDGGDGIDTASYESSTAAVIVNLFTGVHSGGDASGDALVNVENLRGSDHADQLAGDNNNNVIEGGLGDDSLNGVGGDDYASYENAAAGVTVSLALQGTYQNTVSAGSDNLNNFENLRGSSHNDDLTGDGNNNILEGGLGDDTLNGGGGSDTAFYMNNEFGVTIDLTLQGTAQDTQNAGMDTLNSIENVTGSEFADTLTGDAQANVLIGAGGIDQINGGGGNDTIFAGTENDVVAGGAGSDTIFGQEGDDTITGGTETDFLLGGMGVDTLFGEDGDDQLFGEDGNDIMYGQDGEDILLGGIGHDAMFGGAMTDTFFGEAGNDQILGGDGGDVIFGQAGSDFLNGGNDGDFIFGGDETDTIYGEFGNDQLLGDAGGDVIFGQWGEDIIYGGTGGDFLFGGDDTDTIYGGSETDLLFGEAGGDVLFGEGGDDRIEGNEGGDFIFGGDGVDTVFGGADVDQIYGDGDGDVLNGGAANDNLFGGEGGDFLFGDTGSDRINGGIGNDQLYGGSNGVLDVGVSDTFVFETGFGVDTIQDYDVGIDIVEFSGIAGLTSYGDLTITEVGGSAVATFGSDSVTFTGIDMATLDANSADFVFV